MGIKISTCIKRIIKRGHFTKQQMALIDLCKSSRLVPEEDIVPTALLCQCRISNGSKFYNGDVRVLNNSRVKKMKGVKHLNPSEIKYLCSPYYKELVEILKFWGEFYKTIQPATLAKFKLQEIQRMEF